MASREHSANRGSRDPSANRAGDESNKPVSFGFKMDNMSMAEKNNILHEAYQWLVKKYIPKESRKKKKKSMEADSIDYDDLTPRAVTPVAPEEEEPIDSAIDFSHLHT